QGSEVDPGPAGGQSGIGEGESVAALTTPPSATNAPAISAPSAGTPAATTPPATDAAPTAPRPIRLRRCRFGHRPDPGRLHCPAVSAAG
ncbi:hypothetical protein EN943_10510, partial [Mesorhizobium sp. M7A.F.Ca.US.006.01.1.1]